MENLIFSLNATIPIFLVMVAGYLFRQAGIVDDGFVKTLNSFNYKVTLPVLLVVDIAEADFYAVWDTRFVLFCFLVTLLCIVLISLAGTFFVKEKSIRGEFIQASYRGSAAVLGVAFMQNIYRNFGISIPRTSREQSKIGRVIDFSELRPGDLLFYYDAGTTRIGHVTMYIGNNTVIHASNPKSGIILSSVSYRMPAWCVRVIEDEAPSENIETVSDDSINKLEEKFIKNNYSTEIGPGIDNNVQTSSMDVSNLLSDSINKISGMNE